MRAMKVRQLALMAGDIASREVPTKVRSHRLRHTYASLARYASSLAPPAVAAVLGLNAGMAIGHADGLVLASLKPELPQPALLAQLELEFEVEESSQSLGNGNSAVALKDSSVCNDHVPESTGEVDVESGSATSGIPDSEFMQACDELFTDEIWEQFTNHKDFRLWRRPKGALYQYRATGTYDNVSAEVLQGVLMNNEYRRRWDSSVARLETVMTLPDGTEMLQWWVKYPFPMADREYIFQRKVQKVQDAIVIVNRATDTDFPENKNKVRVTEYRSDIVLRPHTTASEPGVDVAVAYFDDPRAASASMVNWAASTAMPRFLDSLQLSTEEWVKGHSNS